MSISAFEEKGLSFHRSKVGHMDATRSWSEESHLTGVWHSLQGGERSPIISEDTALMATPERISRCALKQTTRVRETGVNFIQACSERQ